MKKDNQTQNPDPEPGFRNIAKILLLLAILTVSWFVLDRLINGPGDGVKNVTQTPPPSPEAAQPRAPSFFVLLKGAETGAVPSDEFSVFLKKINLPKGHDRSALIEPGETYWLANPKGSWQVTCKSVRAVAPAVGGPLSEKLEIALQSGSPVQGNYWLLSKDPFPRQRWQWKQVPAKGVDLRVIVTADRQEFMLDSVGIPGGPDEEGDGPAQVRVDIHRKSGNSGEWTKISSFMTNSEVRPYLDVDGDGVPEILNIEWYDEKVLRSFYPKVEVVAVDRSGV